MSQIIKPFANLMLFVRNDVAIFQMFLPLSFVLGHGSLQGLI